MGEILLEPAIQFFEQHFMPNIDEPSMLNEAYDNVIALYSQIISISRQVKDRHPLPEYHDFAQAIDVALTASEHMLNEEQNEETLIEFTKLSLRLVALLISDLPDNHPSVRQFTELLEMSPQEYALLCLAEEIPDENHPMWQY